jgi:phosphopantothenate synthetase
LVAKETVELSHATGAGIEVNLFYRSLEREQAIEKMLALGQRVEQQAFAKHSLNFVIDVYLPEKLAKRDEFLP